MNKRPTKPADQDSADRQGLTAGDIYPDEVLLGLAKLLTPEAIAAFDAWAKAVREAEHNEL